LTVHVLGDPAQQPALRNGPERYSDARRQKRPHRDAGGARIADRLDRDSSRVVIIQELVILQRVVIAIVVSSVFVAIVVLEAGQHGLVNRSVDGTVRLRDMTTPIAATAAAPVVGSIVVIATMVVLYLAIWRERWIVQVLRLPLLLP
jgi:hypothetical protein